MSSLLYIKIAKKLIYYKKMIQVLSSDLTKRAGSDIFIWRQTRPKMMMTPQTTQTQVITQAQYVAAVDLNRAREWRCLQLVTLGEIVLFCVLGWAIMFPHDLYLVLKPILADTETFWKIYRGMTLFASLLLFFGLLLPILASININRFSSLRCPTCRKNLFYRPQYGLNIANLCSHCGAVLFADDPLFAANYRYNSSTAISLTFYVSWMINFMIAAKCLAKSKIWTTDIASYSWVLAALLLFLLPVLYYLPSNKFLLRRGANHKPQERHLDQTVILHATRTEIKNTLNLTVGGILIYMLLGLLGLVGICAVTPPNSTLALIAASIWLVVFFAGFVWLAIWYGKKISLELSNNCPVCKRGASYSFVWRGRQRVNGFDNIFWQQVLKTGRCRHCGCRIVFADDPSTDSTPNAVVSDKEA